MFNHEFIQVECGDSHTLLLNKAGQVFSFGNGLQAQLGTEKQVIHQPEPTQVFFSEQKKGVNVHIARVAASANNSVAFTSKDQPYIWGNNQYMQMGLDNVTELATPKRVFWQVQQF